MKRKNLMLCITAWILAVGSVYAMLGPVAPRVKVRFCLETNPVCLTLGGQCEETGTVPCRVRINGIDYQAFKAGCVTLLKHTSNDVVATLASTDICEIYNPPL